MPQALTLPGFGVIDGKLYIAGGSGDAGYLDTLYIYDIATNHGLRPERTCYRLSHGPAARSLTTGLVPNSIYMAAGYRILRRPPLPRSTTRAVIRGATDRT